MDDFDKNASNLEPISIDHDSKRETCDEHGEYVSRSFKLPMSRIVRWSGCQKCAEALEAEKEAQRLADEAKEKQRRMEAKLKQAGIPRRFREKNFSNYVADTDGKEKAKATAMAFANDFERHFNSGTTMVFSGQPGTGKSHLALAIAQEIMPMGATALYVSAIDAVRMVRDTWRRDSEQTERQVLNTLAYMDLLILDEIGVQYGTDGEQVTLFDIIDKRYRDMMPTILLTNQNRAGMKQFLGDRSFDRLREGGIWVTFDWASQRGSA